MDLPDDWTTDTVRANGVDLRYYRTGDGPALVMAHGFYDNGLCFEPLASDLASEYDVVTYDARAHGRSDAPASGYEIEDRVADLVGLVEALDLESPILFGHSMGGNTVGQTAATHPALPRAAIMEDPVGMLDVPTSPPDERARSVRETVRGWRSRTVDDIANEYAEARPNLARRLAVARTECRPAIAEISRAGFPDATETFPDVECPTLVLKADADPAERVRDLDTADELLDGRLVHVPGAGHCVFRDRYDAAVAELRTFLRRV